MLNLNKFVITQRWLAVGRKYLVCDEMGACLFYIEQTALIQMQPTFVAYQDTLKQRKLFSFQQKRGFADDYSITDENNTPIGTINRAKIYDVSGHELASIRRRGGGEITRKGFVIFRLLDPTGLQIGHLITPWTIIRRRAILELSVGLSRQLDRRLAISAGIICLLE